MALFYAEENWRGKQAWEEYKRQREAKGDSFKLSSIVPPPVPDDQNFASIPLFAELFPKPSTNVLLWNAIKLPDSSRLYGGWHEGHIEDLDAWRTSFTNADLMAALSKYDPILRQLAEVSNRPYCRFPIHYDDTYWALLPHLTSLRNLARIYHLRALAELSTGQSDPAFDDVQACLWLAARIKDEPILISFLTKVAIVDLATQPVWEGLSAHQWNARQLTDLQASFAKVEQFSSFAKALQGERILQYHMIRRLIEKPGDWTGMFDWYQYPWNILVRAAPRGWFYQNEVRIDRFYAESLLPTIDFQQQRVNPNAVIAAFDSVDSAQKNPYNILFQILLPAINRTVKRAALSQTGIQQVVVACALERYRLKHGQLPDTLGALVPEFLKRVPNDVIDGQPLRYRRIGGDQFVLYSVGWNEADDGGQIAWTEGQTPRQDLERGDWVWFSQPQPQPSASERK